MKKAIILVLLCILLLFVPSRYVFAQDIDLQAPTVQYKLNNHDSISLKWNNIEGADAYYVYRLNPKTGKKVRYTNPVKSTNITINNLSPNTEYIFSVKAINKNTIGKESAGTKIITPNEWYYYNDLKIDYKRHRMKSDFYRRDYAHKKQEIINLGDIKSADEIFNYNGWYYIIGDYDAITADKDYPWTWEYGSNHPKCLARIKEDGTNKEILLVFSSSEGWNYSYQKTNDSIYIKSAHYEKDLINQDKDNNDIERYFSYPESCWLKKISLKTGKVETLLSSLYINWFYVFDGYIYYECDDTMSLTDEIYFTPVYATDWYYYSTKKLVNPKDYSALYYRIKTNGEKNELLHKYKYDINVYNAYICNDIWILQGSHSIYSMSIDKEKRNKIYESKEYIDNVSVINNYIYFSEYKYIEGHYTSKHCRIKTDGTGLEKQDKPFEWYY